MPPSKEAQHKQSASPLLSRPAASAGSNSPSSLCRAVNQHACPGACLREHPRSPAAVIRRAACAHAGQGARGAWCGLHLASRQALRDDTLHCWYVVCAGKPECASPAASCRCYLSRDSALCVTALLWLPGSAETAVHSHCMTEREHAGAWQIEWAAPPRWPAAATAARPAQRPRRMRCAPTMMRSGVLQSCCDWCKQGTRRDVKSEESRRPHQI